MKEEPALSINITEKTFCLCMFAAQQLLNAISSKEEFRDIEEHGNAASFGYEWGDGIAGNRIPHGWH